METVGASLSPSMRNGGRSMYTDRVTLDYITSNPSLGEEDKPVFLNTRACISMIRGEQNMSYRACKTCNKKVTEGIDSGYWCDTCQKHESECIKRYILSAKFSDVSGAAWRSVFSDDSEKIMVVLLMGLIRWKSHDDSSEYQTQLKKASWVRHLF